jgi:hypothetical protein
VGGGTRGRGISDSGLRQIFKGDFLEKNLKKDRQNNRKRME